MKSISTAPKLTGLEEKWLQPFEVEDPFNDNIPLCGFLSTKPDHRYGALAITHVDDAEVPQLILASPKLHYPFGKDGKFHFPPVKQIHIYEKYDGTNVLAYRYRDAQGDWHTTYKLRLAPIVRNSKWGPFQEMWKELLNTYPQIPKLVETNSCHISLEMYGSRNTHLMVYDEDLAVAVLFGVTHDAEIVPPNQLNLLEMPSAPSIGILTAGEDPVAKYAEIRTDMETCNRSAEDDKLIGIEGTVWYVEQPDGRISMWKCKPESVEAIHWAAGINKKAVLATCWNYLETGDNLNYENLLPLLREEYDDKEIKNFRPHIEACIDEVNRELEFKERVLDQYDKLGVSIHE
ncbi:hypothetical protein GWO43_18305, partial [candidate division KSB1 bacterium]|nr:hypothetical protein [candidate division KSB1 bacterium]NIR69559.1 hypothetical protein [candidate division KSB1 bacterium]NIS25907.1 hypothetical protein [candidate division KSB1 bacterium]NIT72788.1 hypothetical protein [candidate division KSB1 bacterium]NIU26595.1 hypothetical protein [candidate division KSB1 bacterium]